jgi:para-aminobenzoate synthetase component 1
VRFRPRVVALPDALDAGELLARLRSRRSLAALDSAGGTPRRFSVVAFDPLRGFETPRDLAGIRAAVAGLKVEPGDAVPGPFHGGFLGALAYDLGVAGERPVRAPRDPWSSPRVAGGTYVDFVVRDESAGRNWLVLGEDAGDGRPASRRAELLALLAEPAPPPVVRPLGPLVRHTAPAVHRARIERARERIAAGDFYQANLAHRFTRAVAGGPIDLYRSLRARNPAPYGGYLAWEGEAGPGALLSSSPELLLEFDGASARTRPIKGTARRGASPEADAEAARALLASTKDRAELAMIVDLARNDLGRVSAPGSVRTEAFPRLETYAAVHHLVADVVATPRAGTDAVDFLAALFPGASITGAPKLAAMDAIAELEGEGRGFFTGSLGFLDTRGRACWNILIRTLVWRPGEVSFHVGGGITWSSDAAAEDEETLAKGAALAAALEPSEAAADAGKKAGFRASYAAS